MKSVIGIWSTAQSRNANVFYVDRLSLGELLMCFCKLELELAMLGLIFIARSLLTDSVNVIPRALQIILCILRRSGANFSMRLFGTDFTGRSSSN